MKVHGVILLTMLLVSCDQEIIPSSLENETTQKSLELASAWLEALASHDLGKLQLIMSTDIVVYGLRRRCTFTTTF